MSVRGAQVARIGKYADLKFGPAEYQAMIADLNFSMSEVDQKVALKALEIVEKKIGADPMYLWNKSSELARIAAEFLDRTRPRDSILELRKHEAKAPPGKNGTDRGFESENETREKENRLVRFGRAVRGNHIAFRKVIETPPASASYFKDALVSRVMKAF